MPSCCIKNCKSRTSGSTKTKNVKFFMFPQDGELQEKWLKACQLEVSSGLVCEQHFTPDCIEERMSQPRLPNVEPRVIRQLKPGSIPTQLLNLPKTRRTSAFRNATENEERESHGKRTCRTGIPTYTELIGYIRNGKENCNSNGKENCNSNEKENCNTNEKQNCNSNEKQNCNSNDKQNCNSNEKENSNIVTNSESTLNTEFETSELIDFILNEKENLNAIESVTFTDLTSLEFDRTSNELIDYILNEKENFDISNGSPTFAELVSSTELASEIVKFTELAACNEITTTTELRTCNEFVSSTELVNSTSSSDLLACEFVESAELSSCTDFSTSTELLACADIASCTELGTATDYSAATDLIEQTDISTSTDFSTSTNLITEADMSVSTEIASSIKETSINRVSSNEQSATPSALTVTVIREDYPLLSSHAPQLQSESSFGSSETFSLQQRVKELEEQNVNLIRENKLLTAQNHRLLVLLQKESSHNKFLEKLQNFEMPNVSAAMRLSV